MLRNEAELIRKMASPAYRNIVFIDAVFRPEIRTNSGCRVMHDGYAMADPVLSPHASKTMTLFQKFRRFIYSMQVSPSHATIENANLNVVVDLAIRSTIRPRSRT